MPKHEQYLSNNQVFSLACMVILGLGLGLIVYLDFNIRLRIAEQFKQQIEAELDQRAQILRSDLITNQHVIDFFHSTPPVKGILRALENNGVDPVDNTPVAVWYERFETIIEAFMENHKEIGQARFIRFDEAGSELIRVEQTNGNIRVIPDYRLQTKGDTDYYKKALQLHPEEIFVSPINLNREWGEIEFPNWPTYRVIRSVFDQQGAPFGFLIINIDVGNLLEALSKNLPNSLQLYLLNRNGGAIIHPEEEQAFAYEFTPGQTWSAGKAQPGQGIFKHFSVDKRSDNDFYFLSKTVNASRHSENQLTFILGFNQDGFNAELNARRSSSVMVIIGLTLFVLLVMAYYQKQINRRLSLMKKEAEYQAIINGSNDAIVTMNLEGLITGWNKAAEEIFGHSHRMALGKQIFELLARDEDSNFSFLSLERVFEGESIPAFNAAAQDKRGRELIISIAMSPFSLEDSDEVHGAAAIIRDITEQQQIEQQILELNSSLEKQVAERTRELEEARNEALEISRVKSDFIASVSHEIRTPMNGVIGMLNLLEKETQSDKAKKYLAMATSSARALTALIDDILDLSKIEAGKLEVDEKEFDPFALLGSICLSLMWQARKKGLELQLDMSNTELPLIISDDSRIRQILINLIGNAIKFTETGKIVVTAHTEFVSAKELKFVCSVRDTGVGIAPEKISKLFHSFTQEDSSTARKYGGTGLGLAISQKLCKLMGGDIHVESSKNQGSTFTFYVKARATSDKFDHSLRIARLQQSKIYLLEDDEHARRALHAILSHISGNIETSARLSDEILNDIKANCAQDLECIVYCNANDALINHLNPHPHLKLIPLCNAPSEEEGCPPNALCQPYTPVDVFRQIDRWCEGRDRTTQNLASDRGSQDMEMYTLLQQHKGRKVLLVDDNQINLEVGKGLIEDYALTVYTAQSGQSALEHLQTQAFDVVIMDCQMPKMDGFQTTKAIRNGDAGQNNLDIPIIAMTANAMSGSREDCLSSGMNDFITKPINTEELEEKLLFWLNMATRKTEQSPTLHLKKTHNNEEMVTEKIKEPPQESTTENLNSSDSIWDEQDALQRVKNRIDRLALLINMFLDSMPERIEKLEAAVDQNDIEQTARIAHEIRGIAGNISAKQLYEVCTELELAAKAKKYDDILVIAEHVKPDYQNLEEVLTHFQQEQAS